MESKEIRERKKIPLYLRTLIPYSPLFKCGRKSGKLGLTIIAIAVKTRFILLGVENKIYKVIYLLLSAMH